METLISNQERSISSYRTLHKAKNIIAASLGAMDGTDYRLKWTSLRNALVSSDSLDEFRSDKLFKWGVQLVLYITDAMINVYYLNDKESWETLYSLGDTLIGDCDMGDVNDHNSILKIIDALRIIALDARAWDLREEDVNDLLNDLNTISACQLMVLETFKERKQAA
jgi:hypothetical protein